MAGDRVALELQKSGELPYNATRVRFLLTIYNVWMCVSINTRQNDNRIKNG